MSDSRFSGRGDAPTEFEVSLLAQCANIDDPWVLVGKRIGTLPLFQVFDEIGGEIVSVPARESFVRRLYLPVRDAEILHLRQAMGYSDDVIAGAYGMTRQAVAKAVKRGLRTQPCRRGRNGP